MALHHNIPMIFELSRHFDPNYTPAKFCWLSGTSKRKQNSRHCIACFTWIHIIAVACICCCDTTYYIHLDVLQNTRKHLHGGPHCKTCLQNHFSVCRHTGNAYGIMPFTARQTRWKQHQLLLNATGNCICRILKQCKVQMKTICNAMHKSNKRCSICNAYGNYFSASDRINRTECKCILTFIRILSMPRLRFFYHSKCLQTKYNQLIRQHLKISVKQIFSTFP